MLVSQTGNKRMVRILPRGNWLDQNGEVVEPAIPEFMGKLDTKDRRLIGSIWQTGSLAIITPYPPVPLPIVFGKCFLVMDCHGDSKT